jgi:ribonuclease P/MRP protein subunit POP3
MFNTTPSWPAPLKHVEDGVLQLLLPLLKPIGDFRRTQVPRSKGKGRAEKRSVEEQDELPQWIPDFYDHLTVGLNTTVRRLESRISTGSPQTSAEPLFVVLVCRSILPDILTTNLPLLVDSAPTERRARLIEISSKAEKELAQALYQPRLAVLGVDNNAPGTEAVQQFLQNTAS